MYKLKNIRAKIVLIILLTVFFSGLILNGEDSGSKDLTIWYQKPAEERLGVLSLSDSPEWANEVYLGSIEAIGTLLLGNGRLGAMVFGYTESEKIALNHEWLWRDRKFHGRKNPEVAHHLPGIRKLFFDGKIIEAGNLANQLLGSQKIEPLSYRPPMLDYGPDTYQPVGDLNIIFPGHKDVDDYRRGLDLSTGIASVTYSYNDVKYTREIFVSCTDSVIVIRLSADKPGMINCRVKLSRVFDPECRITPWALGNRVGFVGEFVEKKQFSAMADISIKGGEDQTLWEEGWTVYQSNAADEVLILLSIATDNETEDTKAYCGKQLDRLDERKDFDTLVHSHIAEHQRLFNRVQFSLAGPNRSDIPTDKRVDDFRSGTLDPGLVNLYFQYGRYLLMSSSRPGGLPANLHGIWIKSLRPNWASDFHHDCNIQHYYWPAEVTNLSECAEPLFDYLDRCVPAAQRAAENIYGCRGIFIPLTTGAWCRCLKTEPGWDEWTGAAAWLAQHYWWHYEFTRDQEFLRERAYPFIKQVALFYEDYLVPDPRPESPHYGKLITVPSQSPENYFVGGIEPVSLCIGATADFEFIYDVFTHLIKASKILGIDINEREKWKEILDGIPSLQIGKYDQLQEWLEDYEEAEPGHRHVTHLYGLFPGDQITLEDTPRLTRAALVSLERRLEHGGFWGGGAISGIWARLREGDLAARHLRERRIDFHSTFAERPTAECALISEMLLQSHKGLIRLLPALPKGWQEGAIEGLCARGGFEVDIAWKDGRLSTATIRSKLGGLCRIRTSLPCKLKSSISSEFSIVDKDKTIEYEFKARSGERIKDYILDFDTETGGVYVLVATDKE